MYLYTKARAVGMNLFIFLYGRVIFCQILI